MASLLTRRRDRRNLTRLTRAERRILLVLLTGAGRLSSYPICRAAGVRSGTAYPFLARLEAEGWVASDWEQAARASDPGRRRFYQLTRVGRAMALTLLGLENGHV